MSYEFEFSLVRYAGQDGILLNGNLMSIVEILPYLQDWARHQALSDEQKVDTLQD